MAQYGGNLMATLVPIVDECLIMAGLKGTLLPQDTPTVAVVAMGSFAPWGTPSFYSDLDLLILTSVPPYKLPPHIQVLLSGFLHLLSYRLFSVGETVIDEHSPLKDGLRIDLPSLRVSTQDLSGALIGTASDLVKTHFDQT